MPWFDFIKKIIKKREMASQVPLETVLPKPVAPQGALILAGAFKEQPEPGAHAGKEMLESAAPGMPGLESAGNREIVARRARRAEQRLLENESLTAELDDAAARAALDWGNACVQSAAHSTAGLDDERAEEAMAEHLHATRQLMRSVGTWVSSRAGMLPEDRSALVSRIIGQLAEIYGENFVRPAEESVQAFLTEQIAGDSAQAVARLRQLFDAEQGKAGEA